MTGFSKAGRTVRTLPIGAAMASAQRPDSRAVSRTADFIYLIAQNGAFALCAFRLRRYSGMQDESSQEKKFMSGKNKKPDLVGVGSFELTGRLPSLPHTRACSTIGA